MTTPRVPRPTYLRGRYGVWLPGQPVTYFNRVRLADQYVRQQIATGTFTVGAADISGGFRHLYCGTGVAGGRVAKLKAERGTTQQLATAERKAKAKLAKSKNSSR